MDKYDQITTADEKGYAQSAREAAHARA